MLLRSPAKEELEGVLSRDDPASSYGRPVLVIREQAHGPGDLHGWHVAKATGDELAELAAAGFELPGDGARHD